MLLECVPWTVSDTKVTGPLGGLLLLMQLRGCWLTRADVTLGSGIRAGGEHLIFMDVEDACPEGLIPEIIDVVDSSDVVYCPREGGGATSVLELRRPQYSSRYGEIRLPATGLLLLT